MEFLSLVPVRSVKSRQTAVFSVPDVRSKALVAALMVQEGITATPESSRRLIFFVPGASAAKMYATNQLSGSRAQRHNFPGGRSVIKKGIIAAKACLTLLRAGSIDGIRLNGEGAA